MISTYKNVGIFILIFSSIFTSTMIVDALLPVTYSCCKNYTYSDGVKLNGFENKNEWIGTSQQIDNT